MRWRERRGLLASGPRSPSRFPSGVVSEVRCCPLQWRGRAGVAPASEDRCSRRAIVDEGDHTGESGGMQEWRMAFNHPAQLWRV
jgi:hypothetical protein